MIDPKGLRGFRPDERVSSEPDSTEGREAELARAEADARMALAMARRVRLDDRRKSQAKEDRR